MRGLGRVTLRCRSRAFPSEALFLEEESCMRNRSIGAASWTAACKSAALSLVCLVLAACGKSEPEVAIVSISGGECSGADCRCADELTTCGTTCIDVTSDVQNCGGCGQACPATQVCSAGACGCPSDRLQCGESCVDSTSDSDNCGSCGVSCRDSEVCSSGACVCPTGETLCGDSCVDTSSDADNCGVCGNECTGGQVCQGASCACPTGQALCDDQCVDTQSSNTNCGGCGNVCELGQGCTVGACQSGAPGEDGCQILARDIDITEVSAYQTVKVPIVQNGAAVAERPTPLVAGRNTLVRVFVQPEQGFATRELSARLFLKNGDETEQLFSDSTLTIDGPSSEGDRDSAFEFKVGGELIANDTQFAVELVECGAANGEVSAARFPANGGAELDAVSAGPLRIRVIPLRANGRLPDTTDTDTGIALLRRAFLASYPVDEVDISVGEPFDIADPTDWGGNLDRLRALRQQQVPDGDVYYYGMLKPTETFREFCGNACTAGIGYVPQGRLNPQLRAAMGVAYGDQNSAFTMLHEVGHNHGRPHAPCVPNGLTIADVDQQYPYQGGIIGVPGYISASDQLLAADDATDVMGYCRNQWISDYTYRNLLNTVLQVNGQAQSSEVVSSDRIGAWRVALLDVLKGTRWGIPVPGPAEAVGVEEPAQVLDANGAVVQTVSVYRTQISELAGYSVQVPEPQPGWHAIAITGGAPLVYGN
jgi:hypothetical protein